MVEDASDVKLIAQGASSADGTTGHLARVVSLQVTDEEAQRIAVGTRLGRVERRNAAYQEQLAALQMQVTEGQAKHEETVRELEELNKKYPGIQAEG